MGLILFLIYLGGMLVVFAYSAALSTDIYPEVGINKVVLAVVIGILGMIVAVMEISFNNKELEGLGSQEDLLGVANLYRDLWPSLLLGGLGLFICLFVVLHLVRGTSRGTLRAVSKSNLTECLLWGQVVEVQLFPFWDNDIIWVWCSLLVNGAY